MALTKFKPQLAVIGFGWILISVASLCNAFIQPLTPLDTQPPQKIVRVPVHRAIGDVSSLKGHNSNGSDMMDDSSKPPLSSDSSVDTEKCRLSIGRFVSSIVLATSLTLSVPLSTHAAGYESLSPAQKFAAEAWRTVDSTYLDRTFNGQDWFQIRQDLVQKKYKSIDEAQEAVASMMSKLGDKYTKVQYTSPDF
jgi:hypothetical protein